MVAILQGPLPPLHGFACYRDLGLNPHTSDAIAGSLYQSAIPTSSDSYWSYSRFNIPEAKPLFLTQLLHEDE